MYPSRIPHKYIKVIYCESWLIDLQCINQIGEGEL